MKIINFASYINSLFFKQTGHFKLLNKVKIRKLCHYLKYKKENYFYRDCERIEVLLWKEKVTNFSY